MSKFTKTVFITVFTCLFLVIGIMLYKMVDMNASIETLQEKIQAAAFVDKSLMEVDKITLERLKDVADSMTALTKKVYGIR